MATTAARTRRFTLTTQQIATAVEIVLLLTLAAEVLGFAARLSEGPDLNADSGTALAISIGILHGDLATFVNTLFPPLQTGVYTALLWLGWTNVIPAVPVIASLALAACLSWTALKHTRSAAAATMPLAVLLFSNVFWLQMGSLTFYPMFALLGYAGLYAGATYVLRPEKSAWWALLAALLLMLSLAAFTTGLLFLPVPAILLVFYWSAQRLRRTFLLYTLTMLLSAPWFAWHIAVAGKHFYYHPYTWFAEKYLTIINRDFWNLPHESLASYMPRILNVGFVNIIWAPLWPLVLLGLLFVAKDYGWRAAGFAVASALFFVLTLMVIRPAPYARYFYPVLPLAVMLASAGLYGSWRMLAEAPHARIAASMSLIAALVLMTSMGLRPAAVQHALPEDGDGIRSTAMYAELRAIASKINDGRGVISRDSSGQQLLPNNKISTVVTLNEPDYVTYLSWQSDDQVLEMLRRNNIGWVIIYRNAARWERDYNVWLPEAYGIPPQHYLAIDQSEHFRMVMRGNIYVLYEVEPNAGE